MAYKCILSIFMGLLKTELTLNDFNRFSDDAGVHYYLIILIFICIIKTKISQIKIFCDYYGNQELKNVISDLVYYNIIEFST